MQQRQATTTRIHLEEIRVLLTSVNKASRSLRATSDKNTRDAVVIVANSPPSASTQAGWASTARPTVPFIVPLHPTLLAFATASSAALLCLPPQHWRARMLDENDTLRLFGVIILWLHSSGYNKPSQKKKGCQIVRYSTRGYNVGQAGRAMELQYGCTTYEYR